MNYLIPEWTQKTVEQIFATHLEDWPALLRSMRIIGDSVRAQARKGNSVRAQARKGDSVRAQARKQMTAARAEDE